MIEGGSECSGVSSGRPLLSLRLPLVVQRHRVDGTCSVWGCTPNSLKLIPDRSAVLGTPSFTAGNTKSTVVRFLPSWWASCDRALED